MKKNLFKFTALTVIPSIAVISCANTQQNDTSHKSATEFYKDLISKNTDRQILQVLSSVSEKPFYNSNQNTWKWNYGENVINNLIQIKQKPESLLVQSKMLIKDVKLNYLLETNYYVDISNLKKSLPGLDYENFKFIINSDDSYHLNNDSTILKTAVDIIYTKNKKNIRRKIYVNLSGFKSESYQNKLTEMNSLINAYNPEIKTEESILNIKTEFDKIEDAKSKKEFLHSNLNLSIPENFNNENFKIQLNSENLEFFDSNTIKLNLFFSGFIYKNNTSPKVSSVAKDLIPTYNAYQYVFNLKKEILFNIKTSEITLDKTKLEKMELSFQKYLEEKTEINFKDFADPSNKSFKDVKKEEFILTSPEWDILEARKQQLGYFKINNMQIIGLQNTSNWDKSKIFTIRITYNFNNQEKTYEFQKIFGVKKHGYVFDPQIQDNINNGKIFVPNLKRDDMTQIPADLPSLVGGSVLSGGYLENRKIYFQNNFNQLHLGLDVLAKPDTIVYAPFKGEIIGVFHVPTITEGDGVGTIVVMDVLRENLDIDSDILKDDLKNVTKVRIAFMHLSLSTLNQFNKEIIHVETGAQTKRNISYVKGISPTTPLQIEKGQPIGFVGQSLDNGGWQPHIHITVNDVSSAKDIYLDENNFLLKIKSSARLTNKRINNYFKINEDGKEKYDYRSLLSPGVSLFISPKLSSISKVNIDGSTAQEKTTVKNKETTKPIPFTINNELVFFSKYIRNFYNNEYLSKKTFAQNEGLLDPNLFFNLSNLNSHNIVLNDYVANSSDSEVVPKYNIIDQIVKKS